MAAPGLPTRPDPEPRPDTAQSFGGDVCLEAARPLTLARRGQTSPPNHRGCHSLSILRLGVVALVALLPPLEAAGQEVGEGRRQVVQVDESFGRCSTLQLRCSAGAGQGSTVSVPGMPRAAKQMPVQGQPVQATLNRQYSLHPQPLAAPHLMLLQAVQRQSPGRAIWPGCRPGSMATATSASAPSSGLGTPHLWHWSRHWKLQGGANMGRRGKLG